MDGIALCRALFSLLAGLQGVEKSIQHLDTWGQLACSRWKALFSTLTPVGQLVCSRWKTLFSTLAPVSLQEMEQFPHEGPAPTNTCRCALSDTFNCTLSAESWLVCAQEMEKFLQGAHDIDEHFQEAPFERNIPVLMGLSR